MTPIRMCATAGAVSSFDSNFGSMTEWKIYWTIRVEKSFGNDIGWDVNQMYRELDAIIPEFERVFPTTHIIVAAEGTVPGPSLESA